MAPATTSISLLQRKSHETEFVATASVPWLIKHDPSIFHFSDPLCKNDAVISFPYPRFYITKEKRESQSCDSLFKISAKVLLKVLFVNSLYSSGNATPSFSAMPAASFSLVLRKLRNWRLMISSRLGPLIPCMEPAKLLMVFC